MLNRTLDKKRFFTARFREQRRLKQGNGFKAKTFSVLNNDANLGKKICLGSFLIALKSHRDHILSLRE